MGINSSLLIAAGASFVVGLLGTIIVRLWIRPVMRYTAARRKLARALSLYLAPANDTAGHAEPNPQKRNHDRLRAARRHAMDLVSCYTKEIPYWYRLMLDSRKESPAEASGLLTNLSRIKDQEAVNNRIAKARQAMGLR